jgi:hypothetical protein
VYVHVSIVDDEGTISVSAVTKEELDHYTGSAIKVRKARYAQNNLQADRDHDLDAG